MVGLPERIDTAGTCAASYALRTAQRCSGSTGIVRASQRDVVFNRYLDFR